MTFLPRVAGLLLAAVVAAPLAAQQPPEPDRTPLGGELVSMGVNAALGGLSAGVLRHVRGGSFRRGFAAGAAGGAVAHAGKRLAVERWTGAGFAGRELHAVGASMVVNAADGRGALARVALPVGPVRVHLGGGAPRLTLDLVGGVALAHGLAQPELRLDWGSTLSAGAPVFHTAGRSIGMSPSGSHAAGVIRVEVDEVEWREGRNRIHTLLAHERVHVLQHDFALTAWSAPLQRELAPHLPAGEAIGRYVEMGLHFPVWRALNEAVPYEQRPWEREAYFLSRRTATVDDGICIGFCLATNRSAAPGYGQPHPPFPTTPYAQP